MTANASWTFMVYMAGDNNLSNAGDEDLREMRKVGSTKDVNLLVQFDNAGNRGTQRFRVLKGGNDLVQSMGETDSGDPNVLLDYVKWARAKFPADRYALIIWNHGGGWEPEKIDTISQEVKAVDYSSRESVERSSSMLNRALFRPTIEKIIGMKSPQIRAIASDDGSGHSLDTIELGKVMKKMVTVLGHPLDLLGMDACLMSNLEVAYQVQPYVRYIVASEESEPNEGWPYDKVLPGLINNPALPATDFASHIVHEYIRSYIDMGFGGDVTQTALDLSKMGPLNLALDHLANALYTRIPRTVIQIWKAQRQSKRFCNNTLADIGSFSKEIKRTTRTQEIRQSADEVVAALEQGPGKFIIAESHNGPGVAACSGITLYLPLAGISPFYANLDFATKQKWLKILKAYFNE